jgi:DNA-binding Lrp family transcriptional regulator
MQSLIRKNVLAYLKGHKGLGSTEQIAEALRISVPEVKNTLKELERGGIVENIHGKK